MEDDKINRKGLSREFVIKSVLCVLEKAEAGKEWGSVQISFQSGVCKTIREEKTIIQEGGAVGMNGAIERRT